MQGRLPARTLLFEQFYTQILTVKNKVALKNTKTSLEAFQSCSFPLHTDPLHASKHTQNALTLPYKL